MNPSNQASGPSIADRACAIDSHAGVIASRLNGLLAHLTGSGIPQGRQGVQEQPSGVADVLNSAAASLQECSDILSSVEGAVGNGQQHSTAAVPRGPGGRPELPTHMQDLMSGMAKEIRAEYRPNKPLDMGSPPKVANDIKQELVRLHDRITTKQRDIRRLDAEFESGMAQLPLDEQILVNKACRRE